MADFDASAPAFDPVLGLCPLFVTVPRMEAVTLKVLVESYEGFGVARTEDPDYRPGRTLLAVLLVPDFVTDAMAAIATVAEQLDIERVDVTGDLLERLRRELGCAE